MSAGFASLGSVAEFINGAAFKPDDWGDEGKPIVRIQNLTDPTKPFNRTKRHVAENLHVLPGDLLVSWSATLGVFEWRGPEVALLNQHIFRVLPDQARIDKRYLRYGLELALLDMQRHLHGATMQHVNRGEFLATKLYLPPLPEQRRIAEILDKADALRAKRRAALAQLDTLTQSIFLDMFGDPATNPKGWPVKRIEEITECLDRLRRPVTESERKPGNVPYYGANGQQGWIDSALFDEPLVLVAEDGGYFDTPERGVAYSIDGPAWVNNHAHILRAVRKHVETEFLHRALRHFNFLPYITGTTRAKLTQGQLNAVKLFVPPLDLQRKFAEQVAGVERVARATSLHGNQIDALFASLQHRAFRGEL
jgi:type I restriction enzyme S subunit